MLRSVFKYHRRMKFEKRGIEMVLLKKILKPLYIVPVVLGIGFLTLVKSLLAASKLKSRYRYISRINNYKNNLYTLVFNPYRICNGIRPNLRSAKQPSAKDLEELHKAIVLKRGEKNNENHFLDVDGVINSVNNMKRNAQLKMDAELRRRHVERALAVVATVSEEPNTAFRVALEQFVAGELSLEELESRVDALAYLEAKE